MGAQAGVGTAEEQSETNMESEIVRPARRKESTARKDSSLVTPPASRDATQKVVGKAEDIVNKVEKKADKVEELAGKEEETAEEVEARAARAAAARAKLRAALGFGGGLEGVKNVGVRNRAPGAANGGVASGVGKHGAGAKTELASAREALSQVVKIIDTSDTSPKINGLLNGDGKVENKGDVNGDVITEGTKEAAGNAKGCVADPEKAARIAATKAKMREALLAAAMAQAGRGAPPRPSPAPAPVPAKGQGQGVQGGQGRESGRRMSTPTSGGVRGAGGEGQNTIWQFFEEGKKKGTCR